jgi:hypothetical protein
MGHPNLSDDINHHLDDPERLNDLDLSTIGPGVSVVWWTRNTRYQATRRDDGLWDVEGNHQWFPAIARIVGSTWGGSMIKVNHIGVGMHVEMVLVEGKLPRTVLTSPVSRIGDTPVGERVS